MVALSDSRGDYYYTPIVNFEIQTGRVHNATTMYLWVKYTTASRVYIHLVAKAVRIESAMG